MLLRYTERALWILGCGAILYCGWFWFQGAYAQAQGEKELLRTVLPSRVATLREGSVVGRIEIPSVDLSTVIFEGTTEDTLIKGVGHLSASPRPDQAGNVVLAGHRDTFFRPLKHIQKGAAIVLKTPQGSFRYVVESTSTVSPDAVEVLQPTPRPVLTLITCYPFSFIGNAPERYIVRAVPAI